MTATETKVTNVMTQEALLNHWQGHRRVTRRVIEAFPEDKLFSFTIGGMRPFSEMVAEFLKMTIPIVHGVATGKWAEREGWINPETKADLLRLWDEDTKQLNQLWPTIPPSRFEEVDKAFGMWESSGVMSVMYGIDNEVHHRGQGYCYLRALGIEPPAFWERA